MVVQKVEKLRPERWPDLPKVLQGVSGRARIESRSPNLHLALTSVEPAQDVMSPAKKARVDITSCPLCRASQPLSQLVLSELASGGGGTTPSITQRKSLRKKERLRGSLPDLELGFFRVPVFHKLLGNFFEISVPKPHLQGF